MRTAPSSTQLLVQQNVRSASRESGHAPIGVFALGSDVTTIRSELRKQLLEAGFSSALYCPPGKERSVRRAVAASRDVCLAEAFFRTPTDFRSETVLIDEGGRRVAGEPTLSIAVRNAMGENLLVCGMVGRLLAEHGIPPPHALRTDRETALRSDPDTAVFRINRVKPPRDFGILNGLAKLAEKLRSTAHPEPAVVTFRSFMDT